DFFSQLPDFLVKGAVAEPQVVVGYQVLEFLHDERYSNRDGNAPNREQLHRALHPHWPMWPDPLQRRQPHHLWSIKEKLLRRALADIERKVGDRLAEQLSNWLPPHLICEVKRKNIDSIPRVVAEPRHHLGVCGPFNLSWRPQHACTVLHPSSEVEQP